jgi:hypothetical protein
MKFPKLSEAWLRKVADEESGGLMACSPELLTELKILAGTDPAVAETLRAAGIKPEHVEKVVVPERHVLRDGEPCTHPGCLRHLTHPCEGCGRVGGRREGGNG